MFDYKPGYAEDAYKIISEIENEEIRDNLIHAFCSHVFLDIADKYDETYGDDDMVKMVQDFVYEYKESKEDVSKLIYLLDKNIVGYALDIVRDMVSKISETSYELGYDDGFRECEVEINNGFLGFFKKEIPEVYEQLKANYEKQKRSVGK